MRVNLGNKVSTEIRDGSETYDSRSVNLAPIALGVAVFVGLLGVISQVIARVNSRGRSPIDGAQRKGIGFPIRGVGFFISGGTEIEDYAYVWPYLAKICLGVAILSLTVALVAWATS